MNIAEYAKRHKVSERQARRWAAAGKLGGAAQRDREGRWQVLDADAADRELLNRLNMDRAGGAAWDRYGALERRLRAAPQVVTWTGPRGSYTAPIEVYRALVASGEDPDAEVLTPELCAHLDRVLACFGPEIDDPPTPQHPEEA